jgi:ubiquinone/menaquinone biosynthesis C-methylase UbiE
MPDAHHVAAPPRRPGRPGPSIEEELMDTPAVPAPHAGPSPALFIQTVNAFQRTAAIRAAVELDLFTAIGEGHATPAELARRCGASERGVRILCDALAALGFLAKRDAGYGLTADSAAFLDRRSPAYLGGITEFMLSPQIVGAFAGVTDAVRTGGTAMSAEGTVEANHPVWVDFARGMGGMMGMPAELLAKLVLGADPSRPVRVLDLAAGHGMFGIAFARLNPRARVVALDWPAVLEVARDNARAAGVSDRFEAIPGSAFDADWGGAYDVVLLANFLHHFDAPTCQTLLRKTRAALAPGGRAVALEFIPDEGRAGPPESVMFALTMLATTPAGDAYTFAEYERMFRAAGFARSELHPLDPTMERVVIGYA